MLEALLSQIQANERFFVISHISPDGDAVGSTLALTYALRQLGKEATPVLRDSVPRSFQFLVESGLEVQTTLPSPDTVSLCIVLDAPDASRTGFKEVVQDYAKRQRLLVIDHHLPGDLVRLAQGSLHETSASSACELVYEILQQLGVKLTPQIATCLLTGMHTDTSGFRYSNTTTHTLEVAAELMRRGAKLSKIMSEVSQHKTIGNLRLLGLAMRRVILSQEGHIASSVICLDDVAAYNADTDDVHGIINQLSVLPDSKASLFLAEREPGLFQGSFRSKDLGKESVNVFALAQLLGGGGHSRAAGFQIRGKLEIFLDKSGREYWQIA